MTELQTNIISTNKVKIGKLEEKITNIRTIYSCLIKQFFENFAKQYLPGEWKFLALYDNRVVFQLYCGLRKDGTPDYTNVEIDYGYYWHRSEPDNFEFTINPFTAGSFDPTDESSYLRSYYAFNGVICLDTNGFTTMIKKYVTDFTNEIKPINDEISKYETEIDKINIEENKRLKNIEKETRYNKIKNEVAAGVGYYVIDKGESCITNPDTRITYRKQPVVVLNGLFEKEYDAICYMRTLYKSEYHKYQVVNVSKLKVAA